MDENLVGYLLKALDTDEQRDVESYLRQHPEAEKRLEQLRQRLDVLARDAGDAEPPPGLWVRALARVAEHKCRTLPSAPPAAERAVSRPTWWRRADVLVAAALLIVVGGLIASGVARWQYGGARIAECANNLRQFHQALETYADTHNGQYPWVGPERPKNFAGSFVPTLNEAGAIPPGLSVSCPVNPPRPPSAVTFTELGALGPDEFRNATRTLAGCYAYSLGYLDPGGTVLFGLTKAMGGWLPIMADAPACDAGNEVLSGNSANHEGKGQNVLFTDGHVEFRTTRTLGPGGDDIYLNAEQRVAAGRNLHDTVLGRSDAEPFPE
jgi:prepilin-type processing-associated H-X9-DG protein